MPDATPPLAGGTDEVTALQQRIADLEEELAASRRLQRAALDVVEQAGDVLFVVDRAWRFRYLNAHAAQRFGQPAAALQGKSLWETFPRLRGTLFEEQYRRAMAEQVPVHFEVRDVIGSRWYEVAAYPSEQELTIHGRYIDERKEAEDRARFQMGLLDAVEQAVIATDLEGRILYWNRFAESLYGWRSTEVIGRNILEVTSDLGMVEQAGAIMERLRRGQSWAGEFQVQRKDGSSFPAYVVDSPIYDREGRLAGVVGVSMDISPRKEAEVQRDQVLGELAAERGRLQELTQSLAARVRQQTQDVRRLATKLSLAEHEERRRIAHVLHDHIQQMLYGVQMRAHLLTRDGAASGPLPDHEHVAEMRRLLDQVIQATRTLTVELSPPVLENEGLPEAVAWLASQMREIHALETVIDVQGNCRVENSGLRVLLFQIVRELLFNVVKHAGVNQAFVSLQREGAQIVVTVRDEGVGMADSLFSRDDLHTGLGLASIGEQLDLFEGQIEIQSAPGQGTQVRIVLPLG